MIVGVVPVKLVKYTLMHKNVPVVELTLNDDYGTLSSVDSILSLEHLPVGTVRYGDCSVELLKDWWDSRSIPASRQKVKSFLMEVGLTSSQALLTKSMGLSLSDQYWIKPVGKEILWEDVNFFVNDFSEDVGNILFGHPASQKIDFLSPDNTSDGILKKKWSIVDGKRCLLKAGNGYFSIEIYNEVIASILCRAMGIEHVEYSNYLCEGTNVCICEDFVTPTTEFINAKSVLNSYSSIGPMSDYMKYVNACKQFGVNIVPFLDRMLVLDYIMENYDRHYGNFGLIRNAETLEIIGPAPIFDTGSSLRCNVSEEMFWSANNSSKPFMDTFDEQIRLVKSFEWIDFHKLYKALDEVEDFLSATVLGKHGISESLVELLDERISKLKSVSKK